MTIITTKQAEVMVKMGWFESIDDVIASDEYHICDRMPSVSEDE